MTQIKLFSVFSLILILSFSEYFLKIFDIHLPNGYKQFLIIIYIIVNLKGFLISFNHDKKFKYTFLILLLFCLTNFFIEGINFFNFFIGLIFTFLFHVIFLTSLNLNANPFSIKILLQAIIFIYFVASLFSLLSFLIEFDYRAQETLFKELGAYGTASNFAIIFCITLKIFTKKRFYIYLAAFFTFSILK